MSVLDLEHDIYRGEPPPQPQSLYTAPSIITTSSSSLLSIGHLGTIAAKLEFAISQWARNARRNYSSASNSSLSYSSSSSSSLSTLTKFRQTRRTRRPGSSLSSLRTLQSERAITTRISRMKALEASRRIPRQFSLYLPPFISAQNKSGVAALGNDHHPLTISTALPLVLNQLELAVKRSPRNSRSHQRHRGPPPRTSHTPDDNYPGLDDIRTPQGRKGKRPESPPRPKLLPIIEKPMTKPQAWFLDVASPTWADLRAIGKLLHIHPLTLGHILQQDPREKLELFTNLGYYFISFRAIESRATKERLQHEAATSGNDWNLDDSLGEANIYLIVFDDGICCFHFTDISEHIDRVRKRMALLQEVVHMSSDWIAHDILNSIVDSFFPFLNNIARETMALDDNILPGNPDKTVHKDLPKSPEVASTGEGTKRLVSTRTNTDSQLEEKYSDDQELKNEKPQHSPQPHFVAPRLTVPLLFHCMKRFIINTWKSWRTKAERPPTPLRLTLRRIGLTRKLVTSFARLLAAKPYVLTAFRRRLMRPVTLKSKSITGQSDDELAIYAGGIQDHISALQDSLVYYEDILDALHSAYMAHLRVETEKMKHMVDIDVFYLTAMGVLIGIYQDVAGLFSMNMAAIPNVPRYSWFFGIIGVTTFFSGIMLLFIIRWWNQSNRQPLSRLRQ